MKKYFKFLSNQILFFITMIIVGVSISATPVFFNHNFEAYTIDVKSSNREFSLEDFTNVLKELEEERETGKKLQEDGTYKYPYSSFSYVNTKRISNSYKVEEISGEEYKLIISTKEFNTWQQARRFMMRLVVDNDSSSSFKIGNDYVIKDSSKVMEESVITKTQMNLFKYSYIGVLTGFLVGLIIVSIVYALKNERLFKLVTYDNASLYRFPISISYFKSSVSFLKSTKSLVTLAILFSLQIACKFIPIPSGFGNLGLNFTYLVFAVISLIFGPAAGLGIGFLSDTLGFFLKPGGVFFFGYTLSAMLSGLIYGLCFYKTKVSFTKCLFARLIVNLFINTVLGSYWWWIVSDRSFDLSIYMLLTALPKNVVYLIPQSLLLFVIIRMLVKPMAQANLIDKAQAEAISIF